jgi:hypothetical protein
MVRGVPYRKNGRNGNRQMKQCFEKLVKLPEAQKPDAQKEE